MNVFMNTDGKLIDMLVGYASAHQHPFNIAIHLLGIPTIMLGAFIPLSWASASILGLEVNLAYVVALGLFLFYLSLDTMFGIMFLLYAIPVAWLATSIGDAPVVRSASIAATLFFGGYIAQFLGHAVEKSVPVILKHPVQANLTAPFFIVVDIFKLLGLREELFDTVQREIAVRRSNQNI
jgi:uncharacterized membrane protein YGL010W